MTKLLLDTNLNVGWLNHGQHEALMMGPGALLLVRLGVYLRALSLRPA